jgi:hypothetical protein
MDHFHGGSAGVASSLIGDWWIGTSGCDSASSSGTDSGTPAGWNAVLRRLLEEPVYGRMRTYVTRVTNRETYYGIYKDIRNVLNTAAFDLERN